MGWIVWMIFGIRVYVWNSSFIICGTRTNLFSENIHIHMWNLSWMTIGSWSETHVEQFLEPYLVCLRGSCRKIFELVMNYLGNSSWIARFIWFVKNRLNTCGTRICRAWFDWFFKHDFNNLLSLSWINCLTLLNIFVDIVLNNSLNLCEYMWNKLSDLCSLFWYDWRDRVEWLLVLEFSCLWNLSWYNC